jgi:hypothetical protein
MKLNEKHVNKVQTIQSVYTVYNTYVSVSYSYLQETLICIFTDVLFILAETTVMLYNQCIYFYNISL